MYSLEISPIDYFIVVAYQGFHLLLQVLSSYQEINETVRFAINTNKQKQHATQVNKHRSEKELRINTSSIYVNIII